LASRRARQSADMHDFRISIAADGQIDYAIESTFQE
jgi:hypothetical protein